MSIQSHTSEVSKALLEFTPLSALDNVRVSSVLCQQDFSTKVQTSLTSLCI